ncbi:MAG TPA: cytochrome c [Pseudolabrys sp.]|nr:cytochrome c [Pseudolabrys sp.]
MRLATTVVAAAAIAIGVTSVLAQQDPIAERQKLMKANGNEAKLGLAMTKGQVPFDLAKAKKIFATFEESAQKMPGLFPENSKTGEKTTASPKIWENMADVKAKFAKLGEDAKEAEASVKDLETFKTAFAKVGKNCGGCHQVYRIKKN